MIPRSDQWSGGLPGAKWRSPAHRDPRTSRILPPAGFPFVAGPCGSEQGETGIPTRSRNGRASVEGVPQSAALLLVGARVRAVILRKAAGWLSGRSVLRRTARRKRGGRAAAFLALPAPAGCPHRPALRPETALALEVAPRRKRPAGSELMRTRCTQRPQRWGNASAMGRTPGGRGKQLLRWVSYEKHRTPGKSRLWVAR